MPRIDIAMASSLLQDRDVAQSADKIKTTLSSWDNCMAEKYCKWPVIACIIVGGLIVLSIVWCIARCLCCGLSCCCPCFSCLRCCGNCCGCCDGDKRNKKKHLDDPYFPSEFGPKQGYQAPGAIMTGGGGDDIGHKGWTPGTAPDPIRPKFATFETGPNGMAVEPKKVNDDALPPMPSWDGAAKKKISLEEGNDAVALQNLDPATGQQVPLMSDAISRSGTPVSSPYGQQGQFPSGQPGMAVPMMAGAMGGRPQDPYRQNSNTSRGPGGYGRGGFPLPDQAPYNPSFPADVYGRPGTTVTPAPVPRYDNYSPNPNQGYPQNRGPSPMQGGAFGVMGAPNALAQPERNLSAAGARPWPMDRGISNASTNQPQMSPAGPLESRGFGSGGGGGGFARAESPPPMDDTFGAAGYAQPGRSYTGSTAPPSYVSRAPTNQGYGQTPAPNQGYRGQVY